MTMKKLKKVLTAVLMAAVLATQGTAGVQAAQLQASQLFAPSVRDFFSSMFFGSKKGSVDATGKSDLVVVLDAGHGGFDNGASGNGLREKALTLKIAQYCKAELERYEGVKVYMTRSNDSYIGLNERVSIASGVRADVLVSLHINSAAVPTASGAEVFYPNSNYRPDCGIEGRKLANAIQNNLVSLGLKNRGLKILNSMAGSAYPDGSVSDYYAVIRGAKKAGFPGIIVEHAFISNESDAKTFLSSNTALKKLGVADATGIASCYGLKKSGDDSETLQKTRLIKLVGKSSASVSLKWEKVKGASGYEVYRSTSKNGSYKRVATVKKASKVTYKDKSVKNGKSYCYKVRPYKMSGNQKITGGFCAAQKIRLLRKPKVTVKAQSASRMKVTWQKVTGALGYEIYRSNGKDGHYQKIATVQDAVSYRDVKVKPNKTYYYKVRAVSNGIQGYTYSSYSVARQQSAK